METYRVSIGGCRRHQECDGNLLVHIWRLTDEKSEAVSRGSRGAGRATVNPAAVQSSRSNSIGSTRAANRAGRQTAASVVTAMMPTTMPRLAGSLVVTPY